MTQNIIPFSFESHAVRVVMRDGMPWFVAMDVCAALDIRNPRDAVARLEDDEKGVGTADTIGGAQEVGVVNESGLYALVFTSRKAAAKRFRKWVTASRRLLKGALAQGPVTPLRCLPPSRGQALMRTFNRSHSARCTPLPPKLHPPTLEAPILGGLPMRPWLKFIAFLVAFGLAFGWGAATGIASDYLNILLSVIVCGALFVSIDAIYQRVESGYGKDGAVLAVGLYLFVGVPMLLGLIKLLRAL